MPLVKANLVMNTLKLSSSVITTPVFSKIGIRIANPKKRQTQLVPHPADLKPVIKYRIHVEFALDALLVQLKLDNGILTIVTSCTHEQSVMANTVTFHPFQCLCAESFL